MKYHSWKLLDKITVAIRTGEESYRGFNGYAVEAGDEDALEKAKDWARTRDWTREKGYGKVHEPDVYTFENKDFTVRIMESAGGSSQGGRLSFWMCEVEKDGVKFRIGVNDEILAGLIKSSDISNGLVKQKVMFARKQGQPGLIHEGMEMYKEATADMQHKANMKAMKKTSKWEIGGVYSSITQADICLGEVWDHYEERLEQTNNYWYGRKEKVLHKRDKPVKVKVWIDKEDGKTLTEMLQSKIDRDWVYFHAGKPPARAKTEQLEVTEEDLALIDKILAIKEDYTRDYGGDKVKGRYTRVI